MIEPADILLSDLRVRGTASGTLQNVAALRIVPPRRFRGQADVRLHSGLTERETAVVRLVARGLPNKNIAHELGISEATVKVHLKQVLLVVQVDNRTQLALWAVANGIAANPFSGGAAA